MHPEEKSIAYYISAHGYGHGVRSCDIIRALNRLYPQLTVEVICNLPPEFLYSRISKDINRIRRDSFDIGMIQKDSIQVDVPETLNRLERLYDREGSLIAREISWLKEKNISLVVADIPAIPLQAAAAAGVPRMAVSNFGWDWIYVDFANRDPRWKGIVENIQKSYAKTDLLLRLPFSEKMSAFPEIEDIPLVASPGRSRREELAAHCDCDPEKKWILISFTTLNWSEEALDSVEGLKEYEFFTVSPLAWQRKNIHVLQRELAPFADVVSSVDAVLTKPGFGILSECVINRKPIVYADRSDFAEYFVLEAAIRKYLKNIHIPVDALYRGDLKSILDRIWDQPEPSATLEHGGDIIAANRIARLAG